MDDGRAAVLRLEAGGSSTGDSSKVAFAQALRGWAALSVVVAHLGLSFWLGPGVIAHLTKLPMPDPMPTAPVATRVIAAANAAVPGVTPYFSFGAFGVGLFFLISGFVIPFSFRRQSRLGFLVGRALRLWPVYAAGLTVTLLMLGLGAWLEGNEFPYSAGHVLTHYVLGVRDLLWLPSIDGIVWTLEIELKFYLLCACLASWIAAGKTRIFYLVPAAAAVVILSLAPRYDYWLTQRPERFGMAWVAAVDSQMIVYMLIGTALHYHYRGWLGAKHAAGLAVGLFGLFVFLVFEGYARGTAGTTAASYASALVLFAASYVFRDRFRGGGFSGWLADVSYPLYVVHGIGGYVLMNLLIRRGVPADLTLAITLAAALGLAWALHVAIEKPTHRLATRAARALSPERTPTAPAPSAVRTARAA